MVKLDEVAVFAEHVHLELSLECEDRKKVVKTVYLVASEHEFVILEQIVSVLIDIYLEGRVVRMLGKFVVVGECNDVISEPAKSLIYFGRPVFTFVEYALYACVGMEICSLPSICRVKVAVWIEYVRSGER